ncbi:MAG: 2-amino-4-hydroxy-6-hydroxymethyldihydropteridine diphosphokinase [Ignavibacteriales bacterium]|nr:2-amino-4-hydroxy-6-hydroxymethyldihydropteridine diphosphokinase [Ignavibacteriales bacterium]
MQDNIFLALGSNLGDRKKNIYRAIDKLKQDKSVCFEKMSSVYLTEPIGIKEQNNFYNCVIKVKSNYPPSELLNVIKNIEKKLGRKETIKWGPRIIDIDILFFDNLIIDDKNLSIPHKEFENRDFFIKPMQELEKDFTHPKFNLAMKNFIVDKNNLTILEKLT